MEYNEAMKPYILPDSFAMAASLEAPDEEYMACLNLTGDGMMGYVEIPKSIREKIVDERSKPQG